MVLLARNMVGAVSPRRPACASLMRSFDISSAFCVIEERTAMGATVCIMRLATDSRAVAWASTSPEALRPVMRRLIASASSLGLGHTA